MLDTQDKIKSNIREINPNKIISWRDAIRMGRIFNYYIKVNLLEQQTSQINKILKKYLDINNIWIIWKKKSNYKKITTIFFIPTIIYIFEILSIL